MTVAELKKIIAELPDDTKVLRFDYVHRYQEFNEELIRECVSASIGFGNWMPDDDDGKLCLCIG